MAIAFQCHRCQGKFSAPDSLAGKQAKCQRCGTVVTVPAPAQAADPLADLARASLAAPATLQPAVAPAGGRVAWVLILVGGGLLVFVGGCALCLVIFVRLIWPSTPVVADRPPVARPTPQPRASTRPAPSATSSAKATERKGPDSKPVNQPTNSSAPRADSQSGGVPNLPNLPAGNNSPTPSATNAPPAPPATSWAASPDPPPAPVEYKKGAIKIPLPASAELRLPHGPSHFILGAVRGFPKEIWEVIDLRTGKGIGKPVQEKLEIDYRSEAFSPDGRYLAAVQSRTSGLAIGVWSFISGQMEQRIEISGGRRLSGPLRFASAHQLVTLHEKDGGLSVLTMWDLQTGAKLREVPFPEGKGEDRLRPESLAISPGGRYAALVMGNRLGVVDLKTGNPAGTAILPERPSSCEGAAFSPDGASLALLANAGAGHRLFVVEFATGRITVDHDYRGSLQHFFYDGPMIDWLPDKTGLIWRGHILLEATTGEEVWIFPTTDASPRRFIRDNELLVLMRDRNQKVLTAIDLPDKEIGKAMQAVREGGAAIDSALPPLTTPNLFAVQTQTLPSGRAGWQFKPDPVGSPPRGQDREVLIAKSGEQVRRAMFAGPEAGKVVVQKEITPPPAPGRRPARQVVIERFDLTSGQGGNSLPVPHVYQLAEVSPSGKFAVVALATDTNKYDRLDILGFAPKKHVVAWRPYAGENEQPAAVDVRLQRFPTLWGLPNDPRYLAWIAMLDDEHLLTINTTGKLICWTLPECKAIYSLADFGEPLAISPGRKYLAGGHFGEFRVFDAYTGQCVGDLESPVLGSRAIRGAFRPDGEELTAVIDAVTDKMLVRWDLKSGKLKQEVPLPPIAVSSYAPFHSAFNGVRLGLEYRGPNYLMIDDQFLVDLQKRALVWRYHLPLGHYAANSPDERTWFCIQKNNVTDRSLFLISMDTPSGAVRQKSQDKSLESQLILYPGMSVRVAVDLGGAGMSELTPTVEKAVIQGLESRGLIVDPAASFAFSVVAAQRSTGEQIQVYEGRSPFMFSPFFGPGGQPKETISQEELACRLSVSDSAGKVLWHMDRTARMRDFGSVRTDNAGEELRKEMLRSFETILASTGSATSSVPRYFFADLDAILAGESQLGFHNEGPPPVAKLPENAKQPPGIAPGS